MVTHHPQSYLCNWWS